MTPEMVMSIAYQGMRVTLLLAGPMLLAALFTGLIISLFQAATQINEMTLTFIPKILAVFTVLVLAGPWLIGLITDFTHRLFTNIPSMVM
ncbi:MULTISPECIES: flagellar biosynthesis protein FliQ [Halomonadaceae]|jgi:flagellar biosynthesis protein FliQ|uniref:Flagellar biosynthetic protein FliQ n=4 Tax=Halomonadaceae TaxID=28256 RepID=A0A265DYQ2_9GAMM|nr:MULTISPECIES: flagellar biosynthesis protein FliQ [Halomonas]MBT2774222.1 flagellar biosynthesis protein FliQ [Halomonas sp. ISL-60]EHJ94161.1 Flagellar biosynthetic protein FliQ [Halomonas boliviensis LC1]MBS3668730.1 flagellar biosynthesis protein FliQ [Halomonas boliviensis]MBT2785917.1 flagellar biosynthesis protein FliQ [Halomonas sp. ISL-106]MBT2799207.1 flagellar biosynthesis protein FliQ [Halomonas sp. ISL-104]|tara:strand:- start:103 stop:372 length:270 start_codon:yes stop_codon:yes gene_type:complete